MNVSLVDDNLYEICSLEIAHILFFTIILYHFFTVYSPFFIILSLQIIGDISGILEEPIQLHREY